MMKKAPLALLLLLLPVLLAGCTGTTDSDTAGQSLYADPGNWAYLEADQPKSADEPGNHGHEQGGGEVVATGTPEQVAENAKSFTGKFLKKILKNK